MSSLDPGRMVGAGLPAGLDLVTFDVVDSTNQVLLDRFVHRRAVFADHQRRGRGRRGRRWDAPPAAGIWLSFGYRFHGTAATLGGLPLAVGIAVAESLPLDRIGVKWPNDLVVEDAKLGGILIELVPGTSRGSHAVIGVGINLALPEAARSGPADRLPRTDLARLTGRHADREVLTAGLLVALDQACMDYATAGWSVFRDRWLRHDVLRGRWIVVENAQGVRLEGQADGVQDHGALRLVDANGGVHEVLAGEVHVRMR